MQIVRKTFLGPPQRVTPQPEANPPFNIETDFPEWYFDKGIEQSPFINNKLLNKIYAHGK